MIVYALTRAHAGFYATSVFTAYFWAHKFRAAQLFFDSLTLKRLIAIWVNCCAVASALPSSFIFTKTFFFFLVATNFRCSFTLPTHPFRSLNQHLYAFPYT